MKFPKISLQDVAIAGVILWLIAISWVMYFPQASTSTFGNIQIVTGGNLTYQSGPNMTANTTCMIITSTDGTGILEVCDV